MSTESLSSTNTSEKSDRESSIEVAPNREKAFQKIAEVLEARLVERFGKEGTNPLPFHDPEHSKEVSKWATRVLEKIREVDPSLVSEEDVSFVRSLGLGHDLVQEATLKRGEPRIRHRGFRQYNRENLDKMGVSLGNEEASGIEIWDLMKRYVDEKGNPLFPEEAYKEKVMEAMGATYPDIILNAELSDEDLLVREEGGSEKTRLPEIFKKTIKLYQPALQPESSLTTFAIAQADLRKDSGGAEDPRVFQKEGDAEFREQQSVALLLEMEGGVERVAPARRVEIAYMILGWLKSQVNFVLWQRRLFTEALHKNRAIGESEKSEEIKKALHEMFSHFDSSAAGAFRRFERVSSEYEGMIKAGDIDDESFRRLLQEVGI